MWLAMGTRMPPRSGNTVPISTMTECSAVACALLCDAAVRLYCCV